MGYNAGVRRLPGRQLHGRSCFIESAISRPAPLQALTAAPARYYVEALELWQAELARHTRRSDRQSNLRLLLFLAFVASVAGAIWLDNLLVAGVAGLLLIGFVAAVIRHTAIEVQLRYARAMLALQAEGQARLERRWDALPERFTLADDPADAALVGDLDLLGHASLGHLLNTTFTTVGSTRLRDWLLRPAAAATIQARQAAVAELAAATDLRAELAAQSHLLGAEQKNYLEFLSWAESTPVLLKRPVLIWVSRILPMITLLLIGLDVLDVVGPTAWVGMLVINAVISRTQGGPGLAAQSIVSARQNSFRSYAALFGLLLDQRFTAPLLQSTQVQLQGGPGRADTQMRRLARIAGFSDLRMALIFPIIEIVTLWSFHVTWFLELWQRDCGPFARAWLDGLGDVEALAALATLAFDNSHWTQPQINPDLREIHAIALGHPLLPPAAAVPNDLDVGAPGSFVLITGSNMSGKSTLMRALGLNVVLAQAGGPVFAERLELPPLQLATSIRIQDSLERGVSYYMAELERLKSVVDTADRAGERLVLYLLDEILHGTNTDERKLAAQSIIRHLLHQRAIGIITTHDLSLAAATDLTAAATTFFFTEDFSRGPAGPVMTFDYTLRPGLATSTNALKLMELVGLPLEYAPVAAPE